MSKGIAGHVACTGDCLQIKDAYDDHRFNKEVDRKSGYRTRTILCVSVRNQANEVIGVLQCINKLPPRSCVPLAVKDGEVQHLEFDDEDRK